MSTLHQRLAVLSGELRWYCLLSLPSHLARGGEEERLQHLLTDFDFIYAKLAALGPQSLIEDYDLHLLPTSSGIPAHLANTHEPFRRIQGAIRIAADLLERDSNQLGSQLLARLSAAEAPSLQQMLNQVSERRGVCWLKPIKPSLASATGPLVRILEGDGQEINAVAITPDGMQIISGHDDRALTVWDIASGKKVITLTGHTSSLKAIAITPDGSCLVSACLDHTMRIWDLKNGNLLRMLQGLEDPMVITPNGSSVVAVSADKVLGLWNLATGQLIQKMQTKKDDHIYSAVVTPDGSELVTTSENSSLKVWNLKTGRLIRTLEGGNSSLTDMAVTPDGKYLVTPGRAAFELRHLGTGKVERTIQTEPGGPATVAITPDGKRVVARPWGIGADIRAKRIIQVWDFTSGQLESTLEGHSDSVTAIALTPDSKKVVSGSSDGTIRIWDLARATEAITSERHKHSVHAVGISPGGDWAVSASMDKTIKLWDAKTGDLLRTSETHYGEVRAMAVIPRTFCHVAVGLRDGTLRIVDARAEFLGVKRAMGGYSEGISTVAISADGTKAVSGGEDGSVKLWDLRNGTLIDTLKGQGSPVNAITLTPDGAIAVSSSDDNRLKAWELATGRLIRDWDAHHVRAVSITPEGGRALSGGGEGWVVLWDIKSGSPLRIFRGHSGTVYGLAVARNGTLLASASSDRTVRLWHLESLEALEASLALQYRTSIGTFTADFLLTSLALASDGKTLVTGDIGGNVHFLEVIDSCFPKD